MIARFNPTGTHIHKGFLKVRIDLYPEPTDKTFAIHWIDRPPRLLGETEPVSPELKDAATFAYICPQHGEFEVISDIPKPSEQCPACGQPCVRPKQLNPCLCHFITIDADTSFDSVVSYVQGIFGKETLDRLDDLLGRIDIPENRHKVGQIMRPKYGIGKVLPLDTNVPKLQKGLNSRFAGLEIKV